MKWPEVLAAMAFLVALMAFIAVCPIYSIPYFRDPTVIYHKLFRGFLTGIGGAGMVAFFIGAACFFLPIRSHPRATIWGMYLANFTMALVLSLMFFVPKKFKGAQNFILGGFYFIVLIMSAIDLARWKGGIPYCALVLQTAKRVADRFQYLYFITAVGCLVAGIVMSLFMFALAAVYFDRVYFEVPGGEIKAMVIITFISFFSIWFLHWVRLVLHTISAFAYGTWFLHSREIPPKVLRRATQVALGRYFGRICLASCILAVIELFRLACFFITVPRVHMPPLPPLRWILNLFGLFFTVLSVWFQVFNRYVFSHIALYSQPYFPAMKTTWRFMKKHKEDTVVHRCLISHVFFLEGVLSGYLGILFASFAKVKRNGQVFGMVSGYCFVYGWQLTGLMTAVLCAGVDTLCVAMAKEWTVLERDQPELYALLNELRVDLKDREAPNNYEMLLPVPEVGIPPPAFG